MKRRIMWKTNIGYGERCDRNKIFTFWVLIGTSSGVTFIPQIWSWAESRILGSWLIKVWMKFESRGRHRWKFGRYPVPIRTQKNFWPVPGTHRYPRFFFIWLVPGTVEGRLVRPIALPKTNTKVFGPVEFIFPAFGVIRLSKTGKNAKKTVNSRG